jgi:hypothetical protein
MWMVNPKKMCRKHLLGEHVECHMFVGSINKGINMDGYFRNKLLLITNLKKRHEELAREMIRRGMNHKSELPNFIWGESETGEIDIKANELDLHNRCKECKF